MPSGAGKARPATGRRSSVCGGKRAYECLPGDNKRQRVGLSTTPADRLTASHPNHVWAIDYQFDVTAWGRTIRTRLSGCSPLMSLANRWRADHQLQLYERGPNGQEGGAFVAQSRRQGGAEQVKTNGDGNPKRAHLWCRRGERHRQPSWSPSRSLAAALVCLVAVGGRSGAHLSIACSPQDWVGRSVAPVAQFTRGPSCRPELTRRPSERMVVGSSICARRPR
jgi:hypothetical protein